jgi:hypothetical protein
MKPRTFVAEVSENPRSLNLVQFETLHEIIHDSWRHFSKQTAINHVAHLVSF